MAWLVSFVEKGRTSTKICTWKANDKDPIHIQLNHTSCTRRQSENGTSHIKDDIKYQRAPAVSLEDSFFLADGHQVILNKANKKSKQTENEQTIAIWAATWQNQQFGCAPSEDSDQPGNPPSLIRVFAVRTKKAWVLSYPMSAQRRLIRRRMHRLIWVFAGRTLILLVLSWGGSFE